MPKSTKSKTIMQAYDEYAEQVLGGNSMKKTFLDAIDDRLSAAQASMEDNVLVGGTKIRTHTKDECIGYWCCIHNPSPHHMRSWEQHWDEYDLIMYRICEHGMMHPDPDDPYEFRISKIHTPGCDGCCRSRDRIKRRNI